MSAMKREIKDVTLFKLGFNFVRQYEFDSFLTRVYEREDIKFEKTYDFSGYILSELLIQQVIFNDVEEKDLKVFLKFYDKYV